MCTYSPVVAELEAELNTQSILQWKQDILDNIKDESDDPSTAITIPFLLLGSKQDKVSILLLRVHMICAATIISCSCLRKYKR